MTSMNSFEMPFSRERQLILFVIADGIIYRHSMTVEIQILKEIIEI